MSKESIIFVKNCKLTNLLLLLIIVFSCNKFDLVRTNPQDPKSINYNSTTTVTDIDGNVYNTVNIDTQIWMKENLKTTKFNDGTNVPLVTDNSAWSNLISPGYCWYDNDATSYKNIYGALYNWYTVNTGHLCPTGWHVPADTEWQTLEMYLGMKQTESNLWDTIRGTTEGGKMKEAGTLHWSSPNTGATNESGFCGLPANYRVSVFYAGISCSTYTIQCFWWSSTEASNKMLASWMRALGYDHSKIYRGQVGKACGLSVRCIKD